MTSFRGGKIRIARAIPPCASVTAGKQLPRHPGAPTNDGLHPAPNASKMRSVTVSDATAQFAFQALTVASVVFGGAGGVALLTMPGWVFMSVYARGRAVRQPSDRQFVTAALFWGTLIHLTALEATLKVIADVQKSGFGRSYLEILLWAFTVLAIVPVAAAIALRVASEWLGNQHRPRVRWILRKLRFSAPDNALFAWNFAFDSVRRTGAWVRVNLKGGGLVLGMYGSRSVLARDPTVRDLYLQELWKPDAEGWFERSYHNTRGVWVTGEDIQSVEFYFVDRGKEEAQSDARAAKPERWRRWLGAGRKGGGARPVTEPAATAREGIGSELDGRPADRDRVAPD
jgi:hypothetical protein